MKLAQFKKLKPTQKLWDTERHEFTTKIAVLQKIRARAIEIARNNYPLEHEKNYVYVWIIDRLEVADENRVRTQVNRALLKWGLI